jgi:hypothetical protein
MASTRTSTVLTTPDAPQKSVNVGAQLGQYPVLVGDPNDVSGVDVFPLDIRCVHL